MARKLDNSDFDFDKDFALDDFGDFDDGFGGGSKKSKQSRKEELAGAAFKGVGEGLTENLIESTLRRSLPKGYGEALDVAFVGKDSLESLYNTALKELKPGIDSAKRLTRQLMPKIDGSLPESVSDFLKDWSAPEDRDGAGERISEEKQRDDLMAMEVGAIFTGQAEISKRTEERADARERIREGLAQVRHSQDVKLLSIIAQNVHRQTQYQDKIMIRFQRKSLELQMRQYYATVDQLNVLRKGFMSTQQQLEAIKVASQMPDFEKTTISSKFKEMTRNKFIEQARDSLFGGSTDFFKKFTENIGTQVKEQLSAFAMGLAMSADSASAAVDMADSMGAEFDFTKEAATMAGRAVGGKALGKAQDLLGDRVKNIRGVAKQGKKLQYGARNMQHVSRRFLENSGFENDFGEKSWGPLDIVRRFLLNAMPSNMPDLSVTQDRIGDMGQPGVITRQTIKTWNEVIPGMLSRIHREIHVLRTGDENAPLLAYDFSSNKFSTEKGVANSILKGFLTRGRDDVQRNLKDMLQEAGLGHLRGAPRKQVEEALLKHATENGDTNFKTLSNRGTWQTLPPNLRKLVANSFGKHLGKGANGEFADNNEAWSRVVAMDTRFKELTKSLSDPRAHIQTLINAGQGEALQRYGVLDQNGQINMPLFRQYLLSNKLVGPDGEFTNESLKRDFNAGGNGYAQAAPRVEPVGQAAPDFGPASGSGFSASEDDVAEIRDILRQYPEKTDTIIALLGDLNKQLAAGIPTAAVTLADLEARVKKSRINPMNWTIGETIGKGISGIKKFGGSLLNSSKKLSGILNNVGGRLWETTKKAAKDLGDFFNDIWVKGEIKARLTKAKLLAGEYYDDATGKVLKSWKDIKGRVKDKDGNIILDLDDLKNAWIGTKYGRALSTVIGKSFAIATDLFGQGRNILTAGIGMAKNLAMDTWKKYRPPYDVYVKGDMENPVLRKAGFQQGMYYDKKTGQQLRHPAEIKGEVIEEADGKINILVTKEMLERGLVDSNGVTIAFGLTRLFGVATAFASKGLRMAQQIFSRVAGTAGEFLRGVGGLFYDFFGGIFGGRGEFMKNASLQTDTQLRILQILIERLPKRKKVVGDSDGDGIRDGSFEDLRRRRQEMKDKEAGKSGVGAAQGGLFGGLSGIGAGLKGLYEKIRGKKKEDEEGDGLGLDDVADGVSIASDVKDMKGAGKAGKTAGKAGRLGRMASGARGVFGKGFGMLGNGLSKLKGLKTMGGLARLLFGAGGTALRVGGGIAASAVGALATGTVGVLGALTAGILGVVTSPIALTALGLTAAYYGYKYLTKDRLGVMSRPRFAQYGFQDNDDEAEVVIEPLFKLERKLEPAVTISKDGVAALDGGKFKLEDLFEIFGVSGRDSTQVSKFTAWFNDRFKPIFLAHVSAMRAKFPDSNLTKLDREKDKKALIAHLEATSMPDGPYNITESPFKEIKYLKVGSRGVAAAIDIARSELEKSVKEQDEKTGGAKGAIAAAAAAGSAAGLPKDQMSLKGLDNKYTPGKPGQSQTGATTKDTASAAFLKTDIRQVSALDAVKYRAYGLNSMDQDKIIALRRLEGYMVPRVAWSGKQPSVEVDPYELAEAASVWFGFAGLNSPQGDRWMKWFEKRFRPVFLNYIGGLFAYTKKQAIEDAIKVLLPKDAVSIATALRGTMSSTGFKTSIWNVTESPWKGYEVNIDEASTDGNIQALVKTTEAVLNEEHLRVAEAINKQAHDKKKSMAPKSTGSMVTDSVNAMIHMGYDPKKVTVRRNADGAGVQAAGDYIDGVNYNHNLVGGGGQINNLAQSKGDGWHANKETIIGASQMAGVDPKFMASLIAVESGFRPGVGAGGTSAQGLGQMTTDAWSDTMKKHGSKYGVDPTASRTDARSNALMSALYVKDNIATLKSYLKRDITPTDIYLTHLLGASGAKIFLTADPNAIGAELRPEAAAKNREIFYVNGDKSRPRTVADIYRFLSERMKNRAADFGVRDSDFSGSATGSQARPLTASKDGLKVVLMREPSADDGTFGKFVLPDGTSFESLELPWRENRPMTSCIPEGTYLCVIKTSQKFGDVYELKDVPGRAGVLIHAGNAAGDESKGLRSDVKGCIILGKSRMAEGTQRTVGQSRQAMREFNDKMGGRPFTITIRNSSAQAGTAKQGTPKPDMATVQGQAQQASQAPNMIPGTPIPAAVVKTPIGAVPSVYAGGKPAAQSSTPASTTSTPASPIPSAVASGVIKARNTPSISAQPQASPDEQRASQRQQDAMTSADASSITKTLNEQLKVQVEMKSLMVQMLNQMSMKKEAATPAPAPTPGSSQGAFGSKRTADMPKPAVSMSRN